MEGKNQVSKKENLPVKKIKMKMEMKVLEMDKKSQGKAINVGETLS